MTDRICLIAMIAAVYTALTLIFGAISFGPIQLRVSEAMTILPILFPEAIPGLTLGCFLSNLFNPFGTTVYDLLFGTMATLAASVLTYLTRKKWWLAVLFPILINALVVGAILTYGYGINLFWVNVFTVGVGEMISCCGLGYVLLRGLKHWYTEKKEN